jgi:hypothetical protein
MAIDFSFSTTAATPLTEVIPFAKDVTGAALTIEFSDRSDFAAIRLSKTATGAGKSVTVSLTASEVDSFKSGFYRVKSVSGGVTTIVAGGVVHYTASTTTPITGGSYYDSVVLASKPAGYWPLTAGLTSIKDRTGALGAATFTGTPAVTALPNGDGAVALDGATQYATVADADALSITNKGQLTLEMWIRPDILEFPGAETSADGNLVYWAYKGDTTGVGGNIEYAGRMYSQSSPLRSNRISGYAFNPSGALGAGSYVQETVTPGQWIHIAVVFDGINKGSDGWGTTSIYKNGVLKDQDSWGQTYNVVPVNGNAPLWIGARAGHSYFKGAVGKVAVYDRILDQTELTAHYEAMQGAAVPQATGVTISTATPQASGTPAAGSTGKAADAGHVHARTTWAPSDNNLLGAAFDPAQIGSNSALTAGVLFLVKVPILAGGTVSNVWYGFNTGGTTLTAGQNLVGVYNSSGTLIGTSADQTTAFGASGSHTAAITAVSGQSLAIAPGGFVYAAFLCNGTTPPTLWRSGSQNAGNNIGLTAGNWRFCTIGTGQTALPASVNLASTTSVSAFWAGVS